MKKHATFLFWIFLSLQTLVVPAQDKDIKFHHITVDNGLSSNTVNSVIRDSRGFIWIATANGVSRYDGFSFTNFRTIEQDSFSISSNVAYVVLEDSRQRLWVGSQKGLDQYNHATGRFDKHFFKDVPVRAMYQDRSGKLWVGSDDGLYLYDEEKLSFVKPFKELFDPQDISYNTIPSIAEDHNGNLWIGTSSYGIYLYEWETKTFRRFVQDNKPGSVSNNDIRCIIKDSRDRMWISTYGGGINLFQPETGTFKVFRHDLDNPSGLSNDLTTTIWEDDKGKLWIGTDGTGFDIMDTATNNFYHVVHSPYNFRSLNNNVVRTISSDGRGGIWIGTYAGGINFFNVNTEAFFYYKIPTFNGNNSVTSFAEEKSGNLWIGTDGGGLCYFDRISGKFNNYINDPKNVNSLSDNRVLSLAYDRGDYLWIGTYLGGLCRYNLKTKKFKIYTAGDGSGLSHNVIWALLYDSNGKLWAGTNNGLNLYDPVRDKFQFLDITNSNLSNSMVRSLYEDSKKRLWVGTQEGLNLFHAATRSFTVIKTDLKKLNSLTNNWIRTINEDNQGNIWIGTFEGGVNLYDENKNSFEAFTVKHGLPDNVVSGILGDSHNNIWVSTGKGLARLEMKTKRIKNYFVNDGLQDNEFNINACYKTKKGEFLFGGINGFTLFVPELIRQVENNKFPPALALTSFKIFNKEVSPQQTESVLSKQISETREITLSYDQSVITFEFAALNFIQPEKNQYAYRLEGFEEPWNYIGNKRSATYTNLEPGRYKFQVKASNNDGVWSPEPLSIALTVAPPFWDTLWFKALVALVGAVTGIIVLNIVRKRIREKIKINKLIAELEIKALIAQMNPHFIFNCLTSIQELIMVNKQDEAMHYLNQFSKLLRNVLQCSERNFITLDQELTVLELYLELEAMRFDRQFHYKITTADGLDSEEVVIPSFLIQPFVENALWHGLMHKKGERKLDVTFMQQTDKILICKISDNGIGREHALRLKKQSVKSYQSMGTRIITERIKLMKGQNSEADLEIIDEFTENGNPAGTTVMIKLPLGTLEDLHQEKTFEFDLEKNLTTKLQYEHR